MIAALYVMKDGPYANIPGIDLWDEERDARKYKGPWPVIAHPPCERWGRYWSGGPSAVTKRDLGDDGGCFHHAIWAVRTLGGILEHPEASHAWKWFGLQKPPRDGGWVRSDSYGGYSCCVEQGHYGHRARKATWLYYVGGNRPELKWGKAEGKLRLDDGYHSKEERLEGGKKQKRITARECAETPKEFRELLIDIVSWPTLRGAP